LYVHAQSDTGAPVMSAFVEIVFGNVENVFENMGDEVVLRRTIGAKKDEYSLNRKSIPYKSQLFFDKLALAQ